jgi:hypothetical protein
MPLIKKRAAKGKAEKAPAGRKPAVRKVAKKATLPQVEERIEEKIEESKYYAGPVIQKFVEERPFELPPGYGDNRIVLMVRDPYWLHAYWEVNEKRSSEIKKEIGENAFSSAKEHLRVYDTENWNSFDIEVTGGARSWYLKVPVPNRTYCVDIGFKTADGRFIAAARSNWVTTPLDRMSDVIDEQWMIPDWDKIYALSGGFGIGRGSLEIHELMKKRFQEEAASGWVTSISSPVRKAGERPFWLVANCELIVYGATEPTATVTVQGHKIDLREDGTFSLRFALPDGKQVIPIEAIRDDGAERRKITPQVERKTE